jgi:hypothetical protein
MTVFGSTVLDASDTSDPGLWRFARHACVRDNHAQQGDSQEEIFEYAWFGKRRIPWPSRRCPRKEAEWRWVS